MEKSNFYGIGGLGRDFVDFAFSNIGRAGDCEEGKYYSVEEIGRNAVEVQFSPSNNLNEPYYKYAPMRRELDVVLFAAQNTMKFLMHYTYSGSIWLQYRGGVDATAVTRELVARELPDWKEVGLDFWTGKRAEKTSFGAGGESKKKKKRTAKEEKMMENLRQYAYDERDINWKACKPEKLLKYRELAIEMNEDGDDCDYDRVLEMVGVHYPKGPGMTREEIIRAIEGDPGDSSSLGLRNAIGDDSCDLCRFDRTLPDGAVETGFSIDDDYFDWDKPCFGVIIGKDEVRAGDECGRLPDKFRGKDGAIRVKLSDMNIYMLEAIMFGEVMYS